MKKNIKKLNNVLLFLMLILAISSCSKIEELEKNMANNIIQKRMGYGGESAGSQAYPYEEAHLYEEAHPYEVQSGSQESGEIAQGNLEQSVKAANEDYIILQEITEEEKVEETSAEHPYQTYNFPYIKNINIGENKFLTQINTIRKNIEKYAESVVTLEGIYGTYISHDNSMTHPIVYRNGPGCCGNDDYDGFLLINVENAYQGDTPLRLNDWIKVVGTPFMHEHTNNIGEKEEYLFLIATSIEKMDLKSRGAEMVND